MLTCFFSQNFLKLVHIYCILYIYTVYCTHICVVNTVLYAVSKPDPSYEFLQSKLNLDPDCLY